MQAYVKDPKSRSLGFGVQALGQLALLFGALGGVIWRMLQHVA